MSVIQFIPHAMRGRPAHPNVRRRRVSLPFGITKPVSPGLSMTVCSIVNEAGQPTGELEITLHSCWGYTGTFSRPVSSIPFDLTDRSRFRMLGLERDVHGRAIGLHGEVTEVISDIPSIA